MAAAPPNNFRELVASTADPWETNPGGLLDAFQADAPPAGPSPAECFTMCEMGTYASFYIATNSQDHRPIVIGAAYSTDMVGRADNTNAKWVLCGDLTPEGAMPPITMLAQANFHLTGNITVPIRGQFAAAFAALAPGITHLPVQTGAGTEDIRTRKVMPIPHPFVPALLGAAARGELTFPWLAAHVVDPIMNDPVQQNVYGPFVDYIRVSGTMRPGATAGNPDRFPETEMQYVGTLNPRAQQYLTQNVHRYLPAIGPALGLGTQMNAMATQMTHVGTTMAQTLATANVKPDKTVFEWNRHVGEMWCKVTEVASQGDLSALCQSLPTIPRNGFHGIFENACLDTAKKQNLTLPIMSPAFTADVLQGCWVAANNSQINQGLAITWISTELSAQAVVQEQINQNRAFVILGAFNGGANHEAIGMVLNNQAAALPVDSTQFRGTVEAYLTILITLFQKHDGTINSLLINTYKTHLMDPMNIIIAHLEKDFTNAAERHLVILRILVFIFRSTTEEIYKRISEPMLIAGMAIPDRTPPPYHEVLQYLARGRAHQLTDIPPTLGQLLPPNGGTFGNPQPPQRLPPQQQLAQMPPRAVDQRQPQPEPRPPQPPGQRTQVENLTQNPELKQAWTEMGQASIFGVGSHFRDETQRGNKRIIMRSNGQQRICLPMCLRGLCFSNCTGFHGMLSGEEVRLVAQAGGLNVPGL